MDVFGVRNRLVADYRSFTSSFVSPRNKRIKAHVEHLLETGEQWPDPWVSLNPSFATGGSISELVQHGVLHPECERIFRVKVDKDDPGRSSLVSRCAGTSGRRSTQRPPGHSYVLTTGTGSGKSLSYIVPIVDAVLRGKDAEASAGVKAIVVYPMNALANSQRGELEKFLSYGYPSGGEPVTFERYTGQESDDERRRILFEPPDILLTNYMMLELVLTRPQERRRLIEAARGLRFVVLDELHTYRGRQGADVALLVRRLRNACQSETLQVVGTSATMSTAGVIEKQKQEGADVATRLFGAQVTPQRVIGETLSRTTRGDPPTRAELAASVETWTSGNAADTYDTLAEDPLARWIETAFGLDTEPASGVPIRRSPTTVSLAAQSLADLTSLPSATASRAITEAFLAGSRAKHPVTTRPLFAFRLHQFVSKGDTVYVSLEPEATRHVTSTYGRVLAVDVGRTWTTTAMPHDLMPHLLTTLVSSILLPAPLSPACSGNISPKGMG